MKYRVTVSFDIEADQFDENAVLYALHSIEEQTIYTIDLIDIEELDASEETR